MAVGAYARQDDEWPIAIDVEGWTPKYGQAEETLLSLRQARKKIAQLPADYFDEGLRLVRSCARRAAATMSELPDDEAPDEMELRLSVKFDAEIGAYITKATAGAELQFALRWKKAATPATAAAPPTATEPGTEAETEAEKPATASHPAIAAEPAR